MKAFSAKARKSLSMAAPLFAVLVIVQGLSTAAHAHPLKPVKVCEVLLGSLQREWIAMRTGHQWLATLHERIFFNDRFHPEKKIRKLVYNLFKSGKFKDEVLSSLEAQPRKVIKFLALKLAELDQVTRDKVLVDFEVWKAWSESVLNEGNPATENKPLRDEEGQEVILLTPDMKKVKNKGMTTRKIRRPKRNKAFLDKVGGVLDYEKVHLTIQRVQQDFEAMGVKTTFVPDKNQKDPDNLVGVLAITEVNSSKNRPMLPRESIFDSPEFLEYLRITKEDGAMIAIDPSLFGSDFGGYFTKNSMLVENVSWIIGLHPEITNWDTFLHEWQHKIDIFDHHNNLPDALWTKIDTTKGNWIRRAFKKAGTVMESHFLTELNATAVELGFYAETQQYPESAYIQTVLYRGLNERRVAIGRIFIDPLNPDHYALYIKGAGKFIANNKNARATLMLIFLFATLSQLSMHSDDDATPALPETPSQPANTITVTPIYEPIVTPIEQ